MAKINKNIVPFSSYITQELKNIIDFLTER